MTDTIVKIKNQKFGVAALIIVQLFGVLFTVGGIFFMYYAKVDPSWTKATAEVVALVDRSHRQIPRWPIFEYSVNGQTYRVTSTFAKKPVPSIGAKVQIAYNPSQPSQAKMLENVSGWIFLALFPIFGIAAFIIAPILFVKSSK